MTYRTPSILALTMLTLTAGIVGCSSGPRNFVNENDRLRRENLELRETVADLEQRTQSLEQAVAIERSRSDSPLADLPPSIDPPMVTRIHLGRFSGGIDTDGDRADDAVRLYLNTLDARDRFVPAVGRVQVTVAAVPAGEDAITVARAEFDAEQVQQAYRSGLAGTHYTLVVPVEEAVPPELDTVVARVRFEDLLTGAEHETEATVRWSHGPSGRGGEDERNAEDDAPAPREPEDAGQPDASGDEPDDEQ